MCEGLSKISSNFTLHLIKVGKLKRFKKVSSDLKSILKTDLADLRLLAVSWGAYHLTEESGWGVESIMVSDLPVYRRVATSVTVWIRGGGGANASGTEKLVDGKQHSVWFVPTEMNGLPQNVLLNFWLGFPKSDVTIYHPSGISEILCQMVSTFEVWERRNTSINRNYVAWENSLKLTWSKKESVVCEALFYLK